MNENEYIIEHKSEFLLRLNELKEILPLLPENIQPISSCGIMACGCGEGDKGK